MYHQVKCLALNEIFLGVAINTLVYLQEYFSTFVRPRSRKFFFIRRGPSLNRFTPKYLSKFFFLSSYINALNAQLNPICHLLALLGAHHILHISRIRVKLT